MLTQTKENQFNALQYRNDFPLLARSVNKKTLIYFDNGATTQKPRDVIQAIDNYYTSQNANIHRGVHTLSQEITIAYEASRVLLQKFINATHSHEIVFTKGTTDAINLVAHSFGKKFVNEGDEILISAMEHHSNIIPWQLLCEEKKALLKVIPINQAGEIIESEYERLLSDKTKIVALTHVSNTLGTINPVKELIRKAHLKNIPVLVDGAQAVSHMQVDVQDLDADFYCFSAHKVFGPTGVGILFGKEKWLNELPPYQTGGGVIETVSFESTSFAPLPLKFEAGTPHISGAIGFAKAIEYVAKIGFSNIQVHENELLNIATEQLSKINGLRIIGTAAHKAGVISFVIEGLHPYDIGMILDKQGIAVRTGHHCTQPLMQLYNITGTVRVSFAFYNTIEEINIFITALEKAVSMLR